MLFEIGWIWEINLALSLPVNIYKCLSCLLYKSGEHVIGPPKGPRFSHRLCSSLHRRRNIMAAPNQTPAPAGSSRLTASTNSSSLVIPQTAPAGGLLITQPPQTATSFFKIAPSQPITFGWNITSLIVTPTHLTVSAVCENGNTYPVGPTDGIIPGTATQVVWDLYSYQQANPSKPLAQASYTLSIWGDQGPTALRRPGYLQPNSGLRFALYTPEAYTPLSSGQSLVLFSIS